MPLVDLIEIRPKLLIYEAARWIGTTEQGGENRGQEVERFQKAMFGKASGQPWCADFVFFCLDSVDKCVNALSDCSLSSQTLNRSELVLSVWKNSSIEARCQIKPGCLILWQHWKNNAPTMQGHIGIVEKIFGTMATVIEGNSGNSNAVEREGDGVFRKMRSMVGDSDMRVLGFLDPWHETKVFSP